MNHQYEQRKSKFTNETAEANLLEQKNLVQAANQAGNQRCIQEGRDAHASYEAAMFQLEAMKRKSHIEEKF